MRKRISILMVAGEVSGDRQAALLARALRRADPAITLYGAGGEEMRQAGVDVRLKTAALGSVGLQESLPQLRSVRRAFRDVQELVKSERPDIAVLVDNETFSMALSRKLHERGIPVIFYFPPQVWLWGRWRTRQVVRVASLIITPFKPEADAYDRAGARVVCVGHPLLDCLEVSSETRQAVIDAGLDPARPIIAVLPGSRLAEVRALAPAMLSAARIIESRHSQFQFVLPLAAPHCRTEIELQIALAGLSREVTIVTRDIYTILNHCTLALAKAGTSTLELALLSVPMVVAYKLSRLSYALALMVTHTRYIAMPNILRDRSVVPEYRQGEATAENLAAAALHIIEDRAHAAAMRAEFGRIREMLGPPGAADRAAALILQEAYLGPRAPRIRRAASAGSMHAPE